MWMHAVQVWPKLISKILKMESTTKEFSKYGFVWLKDFFSDHQKCLVENWAEEVHTIGSSVLKKRS